jgi:hypothetical protein
MLLKMYSNHYLVSKLKSTWFGVGLQYKKTPEQTLDVTVARFEGSQGISLAKLVQKTDVSVSQARTAKKVTETSPV